jgi:hypothetical protein
VKVWVEEMTRAAFKIEDWSGPPDEDDYEPSPLKVIGKEPNVYLGIDYKVYQHDQRKYEEAPY